MIFLTFLYGCFQTFLILSALALLWNMIKGICTGTKNIFNDMIYWILGEEKHVERME